ncbi:hypothetical protein DENIS_3114 [Desulfonema ishimotonii]|uniref:Type VI secretion protein n=1 Tax=Desulfonema ishimotonii TaxID=45657 RepID=A0A401FYV4_9BACT|nr:hypothetical protein [Desulfonema ishimotonii]GBC62151.1 hypothetical protein DENIS_3114 [Desulfonema ishimotonii]
MNMLRKAAKNPCSGPAWLVTLLLLTGILISCGIGVRTRALFGDDLAVSVSLSPEANLNSPVALELVLIYNEKMMAYLSEKTARQWFEERKQIRRDYIENQDFNAWYWEWVPGQDVPDQEIPLTPRAVGGIIFADYLSPGNHRARFDPFKDIRIHLRTEDFVVTIVD